MNYDIGKYLNDTVDKLLDNPTISSIITNAIYSSLIIVVMILIIAYYTCPNILGTNKTTLRFAIYSFLVILLGFHMHYVSIGRKHKRDLENVKVNDVFSNIRASRDSNIPNNSHYMVKSALEKKTGSDERKDIFRPANLTNPNSYRELDIRDVRLPRLGIDDVKDYRDGDR